MLFREATRSDVIKIVSMLADDKLGRQREDFTDPLPDSYSAGRLIGLKSEVPIYCS
ncbi:hypothetical protein [Tunicatimonas pelagia]|uniref:hypothetical protein n=1 Tax=Tunicatimonas pelagia TaxID=931531 RepID=UPI00266555AF|nr:hypothetical protein [Tunicatimonas pelagia]WKN45569.1 hypothetical protein P0M28_11440 [Tunicatimonas pelagia]